MSTVDKLRADIDAGRTREKVASSDPAAAPLGTDEEAAGTPISPAAVALAQHHEVRAGSRTNEDGGAWFYIFAISTVATAITGAAMFFLSR
jgi:hypothetical protein